MLITARACSFTFAFLVYKNHRVTLPVHHRFEPTAGVIINLKKFQDSFLNSTYCLVIDAELVFFFFNLMTFDFVHIIRDTSELW